MAQLHSAHALHPARGSKYMKRKQKRQCKKHFLMCDNIQHNTKTRIPVPRTASPGRLVVNGDREVMLLHLAESKPGWMKSKMPPPWSPMIAFWKKPCIGMLNLGYMNASCDKACTEHAPIFEDATNQSAPKFMDAIKIERHRVQTRWAGHIKYPSSSVHATVCTAKIT